MSSTIFLSVASICYIFMVMFVYFQGERVNTSENKVFSRLLVVSFASLFSEIYITLIPPNMDYLPFIISLKLYLVLCIFWISYFMEYVFIVTRNNDGKALINYKQKYKKLYYIFWFITFILAILIAILPISFFNENGMKYSYGPSVNVVFATTGLYAIIMTFYIIKNIKHIKEKGYIPIVFLVLLLSLTVLVQKINPSWLIANTSFALITFLMYHTIENPDIRTIKELSYSKKVAEKAKNMTLNTLDEISSSLKDSLDKLLVFGYKKIDKNNIDELNDEIEYIQNHSIKLVDEISGLISLAKINSGELTLKEDKYNVSEMIDDINDLINYEIGNKKINFSIKVSDKINTVLFGDPEKIKQTTISVFKYIANTIKIGNINIVIDSMNVGRFSKLKFHFLIDNKNKIFDLNENSNNLEYITIKKLLNLIDGKLEIKDKNIDIPELILSVNQRNISAYKLLEQKEENKDIDVEYFDLSNKRILIVDDNKAKIKEIMTLLKPYKPQIDISMNYEDAKDQVISDKIFDMILVDDIIPNTQEIEIVELVRDIKKIAHYDLKFIMMVTENNGHIEQKYLNSGYNDYIIKPINKGNLHEILNKYFNKN